jgi:hypothetical protein
MFPAPCSSSGFIHSELSLGSFLLLQCSKNPCFSIHDQQLQLPFHAHLCSYCHQPLRS